MNATVLPIRIFTTTYDFTNKSTSIRFAPEVELHGTTETVDHEFALYFSGVLIASCRDAKALSKYAFEHGAREVRHEYGLKLADGG